ncbi:MAG: hypothetical protein JJE22_17695 [Bacteroidia bacterium]|nr:hypothetical protein [Bacteroidia bacterium]
MYKIFRNKRLLAVAFITVFSLGVKNIANAKESNNSLPVELKFAGNLNNQQIFHLSFTGNAEENDVTINIKDEAGNLLYSENIKGEVFNKKFLFDNDEIENGPLKFEVISRKSNKSVVFEIKHQTHYVKEVVVSKVK